MIKMDNIPKLKEFTVEELQEQLKDKKIDKEFLIEYIVKRDKVYNQLIDKIDSMTESYETDAETKFYDFVDKHESKLQQKIDKAIEFIESKNNGICRVNGEEKGAYTFLLDFDKSREFIWELLEILKGEPND